jgi:hypothetical protein
MVVFGNKNPKPYYPIPVGQYQAMMEKGRRCDIVWTKMDANSNYNHRGGLSVSSYMGPGNVDSDAVHAIVSINGQGTEGKGYDNHTFMESVQPLGIMLMDNEKNETDRFNLHFGGLETVVNMGNEYIPAGVWVMAYAPSREELNLGGRGEDADKNGVCTLWMKPYKPEHHKWTCGNVRKCLQNSSPDNPFTKNFKETCNKVFSTSMDEAMIIQEELDKHPNERNAMVNAFRGGNRAAYSAAKEKAMAKIKDEYARRVFSLSSGEMRSHNKALSENPGEHRLVAEAQLLHVQLKNIMGKAITGGGKKENFDLLLAAYAK